MINQGKNARQQVQDVQGQLKNAQDNLNQAFSTVEKPQNKQKIQDTINAVTNALNTANDTLANYVE